jgi:hypothetical protein
VANEKIGIFIKREPTTTIYNLVENRVNYLISSDVAVAPELASLPLVAVGLGPLGLVRIKRRKH